MFKVEYYPEVFKDLEQLSNEVAFEVYEYFKKYESDPFKYSKPLYNQGNLYLEGYAKTYVANATYRIVLKIEDGIAKIVEVVAIGKRENKEVYRSAHNRISQQ